MVIKLLAKPQASIKDINTTKFVVKLDKNTLNQSIRPKAEKVNKQELTPNVCQECSNILFEIY